MFPSEACCPVLTFSPLFLAQIVLVLQGHMCCWASGVFDASSGCIPTSVLILLFTSAPSASPVNGHSICHCSMMQEEGHEPATIPRKISMFGSNWLNSHQPPLSCGRG